jgi:AmpD protein
MTPRLPEAADPLWDQGWYRFAHRVASPNFGPRPAAAAIDLVVVHSISLPPGVYGGDEVERLFTNSLDWDAHPYFQEIRGMQVSAHFFIRRDGALWQFVSCDDRAWHAGRSEYRGRANCNDDSVGIELEGLEGGPFGRGAPVQIARQASSTLAADEHFVNWCTLTASAQTVHRLAHRKTEDNHYL